MNEKIPPRPISISYLFLKKSLLLSFVVQNLCWVVVETSHTILIFHSWNHLINRWIFQLDQFGDDKNIFLRNAETIQLPEEGIEEVENVFVKLIKILTSRYRSNLNMIINFSLSCSPTCLLVLSISFSVLFFSDRTENEVKLAMSSASNLYLSDESFEHLKKFN